MSENKIQAKYILKTSHTVGMFLKLLRFANQVLEFFSLRDTKQYWGIVYDSVTKQPLDPVIVKLLYSDGREVETCVTDMAGRYGFLVHPGKFKIFARKTNYLFPSQKISGGRDGNYKNLYHGEFFQLFGDSEVIGPNIPMDPEKADWNQEAKKKVIQTHPLFGLIFSRAISFAFWLGFGWVSLKIWQNFSTPHTYLYFLALGYIVIFVLLSLTPEMRLWGRMVIKNSEIDQKDLLLELSNEKFLQVSFGKAKINEEGRFLLRANPGKYMLTVSKIDENGEKIQLCQRLVKIGSAGVFNSTLILKGI